MSLFGYGFAETNLLDTPESLQWPPWPPRLMLQIIVVGAFSLLGINVHLPETSGWIVALFVGAAVILVISDRLIPLVSNKPYPDDIELYAKLQTIFSNNLRSFLNEHSFGDDWLSRNFSPVFEFVQDWQDARFEFHDEELEAIFVRLKAVAKNLANKVSLYAGPAEYAAEFSTVKTHEDRLRGISAKTYNNYQELNRISNDLVKLIDEMTRAARKRLRQ